MWEDVVTSLERLAPVDPVLLRGLREHVHDALRKAILAGAFRRGERLNERRLATELGVSTTPLKEALRRLEAEGLVKTEPRRGVYVTFGAAQAEEMALARAALESMIARLAAQRATEAQLDALARRVSEMAQATQTGDVERLIELNERFHGAIRDASSCEYLPRLLAGQHLYDHATRVALLGDVQERERALQEHQGIHRALRERDSDRAEAAMRDHILRSARRYVADLRRGEAA